MAKMPMATAGFNRFTGCNIARKLVYWGRMSCIQTIRLDISSDADFFPVLEKSVSDFAESLGLSEETVRALDRETGDFFRRGLPGFEDSSFRVELGLVDGRLLFSACDSSENRLFSRNIPAA